MRVCGLRVCTRRCMTVTAAMYYLEPEDIDGSSPVGIYQADVGIIAFSLQLFPNPPTEILSHDTQIWSPEILGAPRCWSARWKRSSTT